MRGSLKYINGYVPTAFQVSNSSAKNVIKSFQIPQSDYTAGQLLDGTLYRLTGFGYNSTKASSPGTNTLLLEVAGVPVASVVATLTANVSGVGFHLAADIHIVVASTSAKVIAAGMFTSASVAGGSAGLFTTGTGQTPQISVGNLATANKTIDLSVQYSLADNSNTITFSHLVLERIN